MNDDNKKQFTFSPKLLQLLAWLVEHNGHTLAQLVKTELGNGLKEELFEAAQAQAEDNVEQMQHSIISFFEMLEYALAEGLAEHARYDAQQQRLQPSIDQIDGSICSDSLVQSTVEQVAVKMNTSTIANPKELLFKELLKRWKPHKQEHCN